MWTVIFVLLVFVLFWSVSWQIHAYAIHRQLEQKGFFRLECMFKESVDLTWCDDEPIEIEGEEL